MLRKVLWISLACAVLLAALALSRGVRFTSEPARERPAPQAPAAEDAAAPAAVQAPEPEAPAPPPTEPEIDLQTREDAAATGMTTVEPEPPPVQEFAPPAQPPS